MGVCSLYIYLVYDLLLCNTQLSEHFGGSLVVLFSTCRWRLDLFFFNDLFIEFSQQQRLKHSTTPKQKTHHSNTETSRAFSRETNRLCIV